MLRKLTQGTVAALAIGFWASTATAAAIPFEISGGSATASGFAVGSNVSITTSPGLASSFSLSLDGPSSHTVSFLDIHVSGTGGVAGTVEASLNFASPLLSSATGLLVGFGVILDSLAGGGVGVVSNPGPIAFGDGGLFGVTFQGFTASCLFCSELKGTVTATISLLKAPRSTVPEPATLTLLGAGILAFALSRRRRAV